MYAIKPCSTVGLIGGTIESYALGIGMRCRESNCVIFDKKKSPVYECSCYDRCVLTKRSIKLLGDLGCSERKLMSVCTPSKRWRAISNRGDEYRSSTDFPGCPLGEVAYHCSKGSLLRILRSEFLRYGGSVEWNSSVSKLMSSSEAKVRIETTYGTSVELEGAVCTASSLMGSLESPNKTIPQFRITRGILKENNSLSDRLFRGNADVCLIIGDQIAAHCWAMPTGRVSYRIVSSDDIETSKSLRGLIGDLAGNTTQYESWILQVPQYFDLCKSSGLVCFLGDGLLPVDVFEFRGDNAHIMIQEASALCKELYGVKYHRGSLSHIFSRFCRVALAKRKELFQRDCADLQSFSNAALTAPERRARLCLEKNE